MSNPQGYAEFHRRSIEDRDAFWAEQAQLVDWHKPFDRVCNYDNPPFARWFEGVRGSGASCASSKSVACR